MFYYLYEKIMTPKPTLNERLITALSKDVKINIFQITFWSKKPSKSRYYTFFPILLIHFHIRLTSSMRSKYLMFLFTFCHDVSGKSIASVSLMILKNCIQFCIDIHHTTITMFYIYLLH